MQCLACGAEMQLREVVLADIPTMPGFERHTFRCSACPQVARRLVICRAKMPVVDPLVPSAAPEAPTTNLQTGQQAAGSVLPNAVEKLHSTQAALEDQDVTDWLPTVEKLSMALKERAVAARASAWAKTVEKLRNRRMALKERAATAGTTAPAASSTAPERRSCPDRSGFRRLDLGTVFQHEVAQDAPGVSFKKRAKPSALLSDFIVCEARLLQRATPLAHREVSKGFPGRPGDRSERARRA